MVAYFAGEFCNSFVLAKMKVRTEGRWLWTRTIGSTIVGKGGLADLLPSRLPRRLVERAGAARAADQLHAEGGWEVVMTPFTYRIVGFLKRAENEDYYDRDTDFTPFSLQT
jgi:queuosine precursor transporter